MQVFHSAEHSRFQHSLGVAALSFKLAESVASRIDSRALGSLEIDDVAPTDDELAQVALAGLAHDLGHGPFSHLWERCMSAQTSAKWCVDLKGPRRDCAAADRCCRTRTPFCALQLKSLIVAVLFWSRMVRAGRMRT